MPKPKIQSSNMALQTIIICRHGKPALSKKVRLTWQGYEGWWKRYDEAGLDKKRNKKIPKRVKKLGGEASLIISSTLPRAIESAQLASGRDPDHILQELVEAALPPPNLGRYMTNPVVWGTISRISWWLGFHRDQESRPQAEARAEIAAKMLTNMALDDKIVFVACHGWFGRMLKNPMRRNGWSMVASYGDRHWCHRRYERIVETKKVDKSV